MLGGFTSERLMLGVIAGAVLVIIEPWVASFIGQKAAA